MRRTTLADYVARTSQREAAEKLNTSQSAISKALDKGRLIFVSENANGELVGKEVRDFPSQEPRPA